jgi:uncharacterized membrane protein
MDSKTASIVSYITIVGWLVAFFTTKDTPARDDFSKFHLKQGFGLGIAGVASSVLSIILANISYSLVFIGSLLGIGIFILWILGCINAANGKKEPVPLIGNMFEDKFDFI